MSETIKPRISVERTAAQNNGHLNIIFSFCVTLIPTACQKLLNSSIIFQHFSQRNGPMPIPTRGHKLFNLGRSRLLWPNETDKVACDYNRFDG